MPLWHKRDEAATAEAYATGRFTDKKRRSYIARDKMIGGHLGPHDILFGDDMKQRRLEVGLKRGIRKCAQCGKQITHSEWLELDHIIPRGKGGCSCPENLQFLCANMEGSGCHNKKHRQPKGDD
jgi:5-methylcytosine-specific restriction endonuclease McrA